MVTCPERSHFGLSITRFSCFLALLFGPVGTGVVKGQSSSPSVTMNELLRMNSESLESLYRQGVPATLPEGRVRGTALLSPGSWRTRLLARGTRLVWQGKIIEPGQATAINRFFGMRIVRGQLYQGSSWLDGEPSLILDYSQTSRIYGGNRDEIRQIGPGLFLGLMYDRTSSPPALSMYFALQPEEQ